MSIRPTQLVPAMEFPTLHGTPWNVHSREPQSFSLIMVYRGLHCPICKQATSALERLKDEFKQRGVEVIAVSADSEERAKRAQKEWELGDLPIGYDLSIRQARHWGLFISESIGDRGGIVEPDQFVEPGLFLVTPDSTLFFASIQTMPFARPSLDDVLGAIDYIQEHGYPPRGDVPTTQQRSAA